MIVSFPIQRQAEIIPLWSTTKDLAESINLIFYLMLREVRYEEQERYILDADYWYFACKMPSTNSHRKMCGFIDSPIKDSLPCKLEDLYLEIRKYILSKEDDDKNVINNIGIIINDMKNELLATKSP